MLLKGDKISKNFPYRIIKQIGKGEGGMAGIYLAKVGSSNQKVVLKIVNVENNQDFNEDALSNEEQILRVLQNPGHKGIVQLKALQAQGIVKKIYTAKTTLPGEPWFYVMEHLSGGSLSELLEQQKQLDVGLAIQITVGILEALSYMHNSGYVHLDLKPENVMFRRQGEDYIPVLIDFGIARPVGKTGLEAGTPDWIAPERLKAAANHQAIPPPMPAMDIYSVGLMLYRMIAGRHPFKEGSRDATTKAILTRQPTRTSQYQPAVSTELDDLIISMLSKKENERPILENLIWKLITLQYKSPAQARLGQYVKERSVEEDENDRGKEWRKRSQNWIPIMGIIAIILMMGGILWINNGSSDMIKQIAGGVSPPTPTLIEEFPSNDVRLVNGTSVVVTSTPLPIATKPPAAPPATKQPTRIPATSAPMAERSLPRIEGISNGDDVNSPSRRWFYWDWLNQAGPGFVITIYNETNGQIVKELYPTNNDRNWYWDIQLEVGDYRWQICVKDHKETCSENEYFTVE